MKLFASRRMKSWFVAATVWAPATTVQAPNLPISSPYDNDDEEEGPVYPVFDPDAPPAPVLPANQAVVSNNQVVGAYKITVVDNVVTAIAPV